MGAPVERFLLTLEEFHREASSFDGLSLFTELGAEGSFALRLCYSSCRHDQSWPNTGRRSFCWQTYSGEEGQNLENFRASEMSIAMNLVGSLGFFLILICVCVCFAWIYPHHMQVLSKARVDTRSPGAGVGRCDQVWVLGPEAQSSARVVHAQPLGHSSSLNFLISGPANPGWKVVVVICFSQHFIYCMKMDAS